MKKFNIIILTLTLSAFILNCGKKEPEKPVKTGTAEKGDAGYDFKVSAEGMVFNWKVEKGNLKIKLNADTTGWVGIGFNPTEEMKDANFIIGLIKDGKLSVTDEFGNAKRQHRIDTAMGGTNDVISPAGSEKGGSTEISFMYPLQPKDKNDNSIDTSKMITVLLAYGDTDNMNKQHLLRAKFKINLSNGNFELYFAKRRK